mmetsp:Transcript_665/g.1095  ORF Transcript_665/g.1095 Transcript_665/m.1095 type:complete len:132 (+) Transcript_665:143-538(+)|eukprot:CAMPEP_0184291836 /NCGR_PEP_ID=MMETSP1049-20130417/3724_1 /TAXON_ID=77928 /ORGANISM="Proteomonas sulcata, Strain CCMP704" /LENGTH=131 /DNA_ID=CAMNT_0026599379 /DNA_START=72 /DNA_END=467 /DNA_ORIENTATION=+
MGANADRKLLVTSGVLAVLAGLLAAVLIVSQNSQSQGPVALTYWEEQTGKPSKQQRWYQYMSKQDAGPPVGGLGQGWDGVDRVGMFEGEGSEVKPRYAETNEFAVVEPANTGDVTWLLGPQFNTPDNSKLF